MFFLSTGGRNLLSALKLHEPILFDRAIADQMVLMFGDATAYSIITSGTSMIEAVERRAIMGDVPAAFTLHGPENAAAYAYITEQYVTHDFDRMMLLAIVNMIRQYDLRVIKRLGDLAKSLGVFTIPYLATMLKNKASEVIEDIRLETRLEQLIVERADLDLPEYRPTNVREHMEALAQDRLFDDVIKGRSRH